MSNYKMVLSRSASPKNTCRQTCKLYLLHRVHEAILLAAVHYEARQEKHKLIKLPEC